MKSLSSSQPSSPSPNDSSTSADAAAMQLAVLERTATAYHEAGHAVMAISLGRTIQKVTIQAGKRQFGPARLGTCELKKGRSRASKDPLEDDVLILLAGMVSESKFTGRYNQGGASQDLRDVANLLCTRAASPRQHETLQRRLLAKTEHILSDPTHVAAIEVLANELLEKTVVSGRAVRHHFQQAQQKKS
ncbi:ATP-dependent metallopeptidase FtsH/Yme1/Tma family protein [Neorhodopirellula pilleata]|uniref:ATP-dependent zinc metalloprotease FtsH n=1 Tax=Neorhodopirellula pilleata TaxID=2714738 RepID=A0A5C6AB85_9BACT|nr:cell division protein FtsH [Neorhodopirellula pilleata]TWT97302.1 ATP-dependent zinc metalloprotease FtsH [Neorhodopirellula pilleata]